MKSTRGVLAACDDFKRPLAPKRLKVRAASKSKRGREFNPATLLGGNLAGEVT